MSNTAKVTFQWIIEIPDELTFGQLDDWLHMKLLPPGAGTIAWGVRVTDSHVMVDHTDPTPPIDRGPSEHFLDVKPESSE